MGFHEFLFLLHGFCQNCCFLNVTSSHVPFHDKMRRGRKKLNVKEIGGWRFWSMDLCFTACTRGIFVLFHDSATSLHSCMSTRLLLI